MKKIFFSLCTVLFCTSLLFGQPIQPTPIPGLAILVAAGAALGAGVVYKKKNEEE